MNHLLHAVLVAIGLVGTALSVRSATNGIEVTGRLLVWHQTGNTNGEVPFTVLLNDCGAMIRTEGFGGTLAAFDEWGTDGTNSYYLEKKPEVMDFSKLAPHVLVVNDTGADVTNLRNQPSNIWLGTRLTPPPVAGFPSLWLAFASRCYLRARTSGDVFDSAPGPAFDGVFQVTTISSQTRNLVRERAFWQWSRKDAVSPSKLVGLRDDQSSKRTGTYVGEVTNATYQVIEWTNALGQLFPAKFEFNLFGWEGGATKTFPAHVTSKVFGTVTRISALQTNPVTFANSKLPFPLYVVEQRVGLDERGNPATYRSPDGTIRPLKNLTERK